MGLVLVKQEERENTHNSWLARKIYAKTTLTTFQYCRERFRQRYVLRTDEAWGDDLIEGLSGHKLIETLHQKLLKGELFYPAEVYEIFKKEMMRLEYRRASKKNPGNWLKDSWDKIKTPYELYEKSWKKWYTQILGVEEMWGLDEEVLLGGARCAGHLDLRVPKLIVDFKFVGKSSQHRQPKKFDLGMEMYKKGTGVARTAILPLVKEPFARQPKELKPGQVFEADYMIDGLLEVNHTKATAQTTELIIHDMVSAIERGDLSGGPPDVGKNLCQRKYCDFWGRCKYTQHLPRKGL